MKAQRRGRKGEVHVYQPTGSTTFWIRYTVNGERKRQNTGKTNEGGREFSPRKLPAWL